MLSDNPGELGGLKPARFSNMVGDVHGSRAANFQNILSTATYGNSRQHRTEIRQLRPGQSRLLHGNPLHTVFLRAEIKMPHASDLPLAPITPEVMGSFLSPGSSKSVCFRLQCGFHSPHCDDIQHRNQRQGKHICHRLCPDKPRNAQQALEVIK